MITIKSKHGIELMAIAGKLLAEMFKSIPEIIKPGITTIEIDSWIDNYLRHHNLVSSMRGYMGYKHVSCISLNSEVVHGVPTKQVQLRSGDLIKIDVCASYKGYCADMARAFVVDKATPALEKFIAVAQASLDAGILQVQAGSRIGNVSAAIQAEVEKNGFGVVREFAGHGIGKKMHEDPEILNYGQAGVGPIMRPGMAFAIEPMITFGDYSVYVAQDGWTVKTVDNSLAMHVEDTVIVTELGPQIITRI
jgi:methionyl aminopeptidase